MKKLIPYFAFEGRGNRLRYWLTSLSIYGLLLATILVGFAIPIVGAVFIAVGMVLATWAGLAVAARRLHDRNKSVWWLLIMYGPVLVLTALSEVASMSSPEAGAGFAVLSLPFSIWTLVELGFLKGTSGPNRFGPDPLQPVPVEVFS